MAKKTVPVALEADDGRCSYRLAAGVTRVNGQKVSGVEVRLTAQEALYDLSLGRIELVKPPVSGDV